MTVWCLAFRTLPIQFSCLGRRATHWRLDALMLICLYRCFGIRPIFHFILWTTYRYHLWFLLCFITWQLIFSVLTLQCWFFVRMPDARLSVFSWVSVCLCAAYFCQEATDWSLVRHASAVNDCLKSGECPAIMELNGHKYYVSVSTLRIFQTLIDSF